MRNEHILARLMHGHVDTVSFVRDYVEVRIDYYNVVRCVTGPGSRPGSSAFQNPGRDALCGPINGVVR
jgi:hypothetical protein